MRARRWVKLPSTILLVAFLMAVGGEVLPGHACPHHDALPGMAAGEHAGAVLEAAPDAGAPAAHGDASGHERHGDGPCTCVGACHAGAATPMAAGPVAHRLPLPAAARGEPLSVPAEGPARRPLPYRLHQPNAPPVRA